MKHLVFIMVLNLWTVLSLGQDVSLRMKHFNLDNGIALHGYDAVAYITQNKAVKGSRNNILIHEGVTYYFSTSTNREEFRKAPTKYEPAYGGWCAYAMGSDGGKVSVDPKTFKIVGGKLNLFYNKFFNNTLDDWNKDEGSLKKKADINWQRIVH